MDNYFKDTLRAGPSKFEMAPKLPRAPKQSAMFVFSLLLWFCLFIDVGVSDKISSFSHPS